MLENFTIPAKEEIEKMKPISDKLKNYSEKKIYTLNHFSLEWQAKFINQFEKRVELEDENVSTYLSLWWKKKSQLHFHNLKTEFNHNIYFINENQLKVYCENFITVLTDLHKQFSQYVTGFHLDSNQYSKFISVVSDYNKKDENHKEHLISAVHNYEFDLYMLNILIEYAKETYNRFIKNKSANKTNVYPRIFQNSRGFEIFKKMIATAKTDADYSFIYRVMKLDGFILDDVGNNEYKKLLLKEADVSIDKIKTLSNCEASWKHDIYKEIKNNTIESL